MTNRQERAYQILSQIQELKMEVIEFLHVFEEEPTKQVGNYTSTERALFLSLETFFEFQIIKQCDSGKELSNSPQIQKIY